MFAGNPALQPAPVADFWAAWRGGHEIRVPDPESVAQVEFGSIGFHAEAVASYARFAALKRAGEIPEHLRFQVSVATPVASMMLLVEGESRAAVEPAYERALLAEVRRIVADIPPDELAMQWDVALEFAILEGVIPGYFDAPEEQIPRRLARSATAVDPAVEMGYHLCYGDYEHQHFVQPADAGGLRGGAAADQLDPPAGTAGPQRRRLLRATG